MKANSIIQKIIDGNNEFVEKHDKNYFDSHGDSQHPFITLVSCSDSRVQPDVLLPDAINKIFEIENIGNQILSGEGSVDYGVLHLKTPVLMVLGHSDCGAIKALMAGYENEPESIKNELDNLKPALLSAGSKDDFEKALVGNIRKNVDFQINVAVGKYRDLIKEEKLTAIGAFYDFKNDFGKGRGKLLIMNVNGKTDENKIKNSHVFEDVREEDIIVRRV